MWVYLLAMQYQSHEIGVRMMYVSASGGELWQTQSDSRMLFQGLTSLGPDQLF